VPRPDDALPNFPRFVEPTGAATPIADIPNSGYAGGGAQWDRRNYIGEAPTYQEPDPCIGGGCLDSDFTPLASTAQGVCILNRNRTRTGVLSTDLIPNIGRLPAFSGAHLPFQVAPGYDEVVEGYLGRDPNNYDWSVQGGFRGFNSWVASGAVDSTSRVTEVTPQGTITHGGLNSFFNAQFIGLDWADRQTARYDSQFNSAEINVVLRPHSRSDRIVLYPNGQWRRECQPGATWSFLGGLRYFDVDEEFTFRGAGFYTQTLGGATTEGLLSGTYFARTNNEMIGLQLGTEMGLREQGWELVFHFKAAPMINTAVAESQVATSDPIFGDQRASFRFVGTNVAALLEVGALGTYRLNDALALQCGYDVSWLTGAAFAPGQRPAAGEVMPTGTVFFQGLVLRVEYRR